VALQHPNAVAHLLRALDFHFAEVKEVALIGDGREQLERVVRSEFRPHVVLAGGAPDGVPLLAPALDACGGVIVNVEVKNFPGDPDHDGGQAVAEAVARLVGGRGMHRRVLVSSFDLAAIDRVHQVDPDVPTGYLVLMAADAGTAGPLVDQTAGGGHSALHPHHIGVTAGLVQRCADAGLALNTWTVDDPGRIAELAALGVDGIVTNVPDVALRALGR